MKQFRSSKKDEQDQKVTKLLQDLGSLKAEYPPDLLTARRADFLTQIEQLKTVGVEEELASGDQEIVKLLGNLKALEAEYPSELLAARRAAFLSQIESATNISLLHKLRASVKSVLPRALTIPSVPSPNRMRTSLVVASLLVAAAIATLLFSHTGQPLTPLPVPSASEPTRVLPTGTHETGSLLCTPGDQRPTCPSGDLGQDLAVQGNGAARPAVSKDALSANDSLHKAAYVNDGRIGASWVSISAYSWIKIDLGKVTTFNSVRLQKGSVGSSNDSNPGQFVIAVASSDVYSDGNSSNDYTEYAQVFDSQQTGFSGSISDAGAVTTLFRPVKARFVKITFEKAGAAIDEVGVFMAKTPELAEQPTGTPFGSLPEMTTTLATETLLFTATPTTTPLPADTLSPTETLTPLPTDTGFPTDTLVPSPTDTPYPTDTPLPTDTLPPANTATPVPTKTLAPDTPTPFPTVAPPTDIPPTVQAPPGYTGPIIVTSHDQNLTFTCNGNDVEVRGNTNTVTLLGSCSSITVTGNNNYVFWQFGSPVIKNQGKDNIIVQM